MASDGIDINTGCMTPKTISTGLYGYISTWIEGVEECKLSRKRKTSGGPRKPLSQPSKSKEADTPNIPKCKRQVLGKASGNIQSTQEGAMAAEEQLHRRSKRVRSSPQTPSATIWQDQDDTPRPPAMPSLRPRSDFSHSSPSKSSTSSKRSSSPVKSMAGLKMASTPIYYQQFTTSGPSMREDILALRKEFAGCVHGERVLPSRFKDELKSTVGAVEILRDYMFASVDNNTPENQRQGWHLQSAHATLVWDAVHQMRDWAQLCAEQKHSEAGWNDRVHSRILDLALHHQGYKSVLGSINATTAEIQPRSLAPRHHSGVVMGGKKVDYGIYIQPDEDAMTKIDAKLAREEIYADSINQTTFDPLRYLPIAVSIETKVSGGNDETARVQLAVWASAQFKKLQILAGAACSMPILPMIYVQGDLWNLLIATESEGKVTLFGTLCFGGTDSIIGIYKIIAGIQILAEWADRPYREWFMKNVLS